jgi:acid phosphatase (class A)
MRRLRISLLVCAVFIANAGLVVSAQDKAKPFIGPADVDLLKILPPPPPPDSIQTRTELGEILAIQVTRTPEMEAKAAADAAEDVWRFKDVVGPSFTAEKLPKLAAFFDRVRATEGPIVDPAKDTWKRTRPAVLSDLVRPCVRPSTSGSYPSGHTTVGTLLGIVLSEMLPERRREIMARASEYGWNRVIGGVHYRSDIEVGRIAGSVIAAEVMKNAEFRTEFAAARAELRGALGLPPMP